MNIIEAALEWRKDWPDSNDVDEEKQGCHCSVCNLIRACDEHLATEAVLKPFGSFKQKGMTGTQG